MEAPGKLTHDIGEAPKRQPKCNHKIIEGSIIQKQHYLAIHSVNIKKKCGQRRSHNSYCSKNHQLNVNCKFHSSNTNLKNLLGHANHINELAFEAAA
jgi:hypothetical protein